jgi:VanZ family protein
LLLLVWCAVIFTLSAQSDPERYVGVNLRLNDKVEHVLAYATGGFLAAGASAATPWGTASRWAPWIAAVLFCGVWAVSDEFHQSLVPGRDASGTDLAADVVGAALGAALFLVRPWRLREVAPAAGPDRR